MTSPIKILQYNVQSLKICLQEIFSHDNHTTQHNLMNFNLLRKTRIDGYGGVGIGFKKVLFLNNHENVIIAGDLNARHLVWGDRICNTKGKIVVDEIRNTNLQCINSGAITHRTGNSAGTAIDITLTNINSSYTKWHCQQVHLGGSKHFPIIVEVTNSSKKPNYFIPKERLAQELAQLKFSDLENITTEIDSVRNRIKIDLNTSRRTPKNWWSDDLKKLYRLHVAKRKKANHTNNVEDMEASIIATSDWKEAVKAAKKASYNSKIEEINTCPNSTQAWKFIRNVKGNKRASHNWAAEDDRNYLELIRNQAQQASNPCNVITPTTAASVNANNSVDFSYSRFENLLARKKIYCWGFRQNYV
ncbi:uncharacterized protein LOC118746596 [Rhagoletis pomonella]|uniref:uncharacterized protein LOC118746596 n=1 Tax=Rhagoletis pomonella TaxID=28610 RepID=UPI001781C3E7|nr:uncharacterized protein LOC118746596 [Rhagoletis pomonella]